MACAGLDCLRSRFCSEFQASTCNIIYKDAVLRETRKGCTAVSLATEHTSQIVKWLKDTKLKSEPRFKKM